MSGALKFQSVCKSFGAHQVLKDISFEIEEGEAVGLVGINGAGKTTLIRGLLDLNRIDAGTISIFGTPHTETQARDKLSYLAERFSPPYFATGVELLRYLLALHGERYDPRAAEQEAQALGLSGEVLSLPARQYSKGMAQKLGLIACILPGRPLLVLDEPMSGLDPRARTLFKRRLSELKDQGVTIFFSTHLLVDIESLCDRLVVIHDGTVRYAGTPADLMASHHCSVLEDAFLHCIKDGAEN